jgi:methylated-DNA-[protein]-cysteine S-methyltransferase
MRVNSGRARRDKPGTRAADPELGLPLLFSFRTAFGPTAIIWSMHGGRPGILQVFLSRPDAKADRMARASYQGAEESSCPEVDLVAGMIRAFLEGEDISFPLDGFRMDLLGGFQQSVLRAEHGIPRGRVSTYGRIAARLGIPKGSRAVGTALATNPFPIIIPCHRAIRSDGTLGGYQGGLGMKQVLLRMECVPFTEKGRVENVDFYY